MDRKRDKSTGRFVETGKPNMKKIVGFRVSDREYELIRYAKKKGLSPREVVLQEAQKVLNEK